MEIGLARFDRSDQYRLDRRDIARLNDITTLLAAIYPQGIVTVFWYRMLAS